MQFDVDNIVVDLCRELKAEPHKQVKHGGCDTLSNVDLGI